MLKITIPNEVMRSIPHRQSENKGKMAVVKVQMIILSQFLDNSSGISFVLLSSKVNLTGIASYI